MFDFLTKEEADRIFEILDKEIDWYQQTNTNRYGECFNTSHHDHCLLFVLTQPEHLTSHFEAREY